MTQSTPEPPSLLPLQLQLFHQNLPVQSTQDCLAYACHGPSHPSSVSPEQSTTGPSTPTSDLYTPEKYTTIPGFHLLWLQPDCESALSQTYSGFLDWNSLQLQLSSKDTPWMKNTGTAPPPWPVHTSVLAFPSKWPSTKWPRPLSHARYSSSYQPRSDVRYTQLTLGASKNKAIPSSLGDIAIRSNSQKERKSNKM